MFKQPVHGPCSDSSWVPAAARCRCRPPEQSELPASEVRVSAGRAERLVMREYPVLQGRLPYHHMRFPARGSPVSLVARPSGDLHPEIRASAAHNQP